MTTTTTQVPAVLDWLYTTASASPQLGQATPPVIVLDGPQPTDDTLAEPAHLWIGINPLDPAAAGAEVTQDWPDLNTGLIDEDGEITCAAESWSGAVVTKTQRDACDAIVAAVALMLRGTPAQGGPGDMQMGGLVFWSWVAAGSWYQRRSDSGLSVMHVFSIRYRARLTT
jgi:hypothetical protein